MQKGNDGISVVISTRNRAQVLSLCLRYLTDSGGYDTLIDEIIVVNDSSDDDTIQKIDNNFKNVRLISTSSRVGIPVARNIGLKKATNEYVLCLDDDGLPELSNIKKLVSYVRNQAEVAVMGLNVVETGETLEEIREKLSGIEARKDISPQASYTFSGGAALISRDKFVKVGGYPNNFFYSGEEDDLSARLFARGYKVVISKTTNFYHSGSDSGHFNSVLEEKEKCFYYFRNRHLFFWRNFPPKKAARESLFSSIGGFARTLFRAGFIPFFRGTIAGIARIPGIIRHSQPVLQGDKYEAYEERYLGPKSNLTDRIKKLVEDLLERKNMIPFY